MNTTMGVKILTTSLEGVNVIPVETQVLISSGLPAFHIVGLPDKTVSESRERVRAALYALGLGLPAKRILINLAPADRPKEGSHYDLPIALGLLVAMEILDQETLYDCLAFGELGLHGQLPAVPGMLPTAIEANSQGKMLICPIANYQEARLSGIDSLMAVENLHQIVAHLRDNQPLPAVPASPRPRQQIEKANLWNAIRGQEAAKRALEIAAAGGHAIIFSGPPGVGKSMLAQALPEILPPLTADESLEVAMVRSVAGESAMQTDLTLRPFRDPHHSASTIALIGGGSRIKPGEVTLAHGGVLFLDELPEFSRASLEVLRQPIETGRAVIARANRHITFPARFQLVAAMNPCRCGYVSDPGRACGRAPKCMKEYQNKISGPLWDRIDIHIDVPDVHVQSLRRDAELSHGEAVAVIAQRVRQARELQTKRYRTDAGGVRSNATVSTDRLEKVMRQTLTSEAEDLLATGAQKMRLSARAWHRMLRVARTIADLSAHDQILRQHMAEALTYRRFEVMAVN